MTFLADHLNRRAFLGRYAGCLGTLALADILAAEEPRSSDPLAPKPPHHAAKAKAVICLFQHGGPSQMDLFDPKSELTRRHGQAYPGEVEAHFHTQVGKLLASPFQFKKCGKSGVELSELLPHTAGVVDEITLVRSMATESVDHEAALRVIHAGKTFPGRPAWGSWVLYGLGALRRDLPAYVVLGDPGGLPVDGPNNWSSGFLPAVYQATPFRAKGAPVANLETPEGVSAEARRNQLEFLDELNRSHLQRHPANAELEARIRNYELAARMQTAVPGIVDLAKETEETQRLYGLNNPATAEYGRRCLLARRLVEQGVRFVQIFMNGQPWDTHNKNAEQLKGLCGRTDQPVAALIQDLKRRGLLDSTIVLWTGEFGRLPVSQGTDGRDHNRHAFSLWLAGGGFKKGYVHGATDDFSYRSVRDVVRVCDLHATLLQALGLDHHKLTFPHEGRNDSLTDVDVTGARDPRAAGVNSATRRQLVGLCEVVAALADAVAGARRPLHPRHALMVRILRSAPVYRDAGRLDAWEVAYQDAGREGQSSSVDELLDSIFDLGRHNLYAAFDEAGTWDRYQELVRQFQETGIPTPQAPDLSRW